MQQKAAPVGRGNQVDKHSRAVFLLVIWQRSRGKKAFRKTKGSCDLHEQKNNNIPWLPQKSQFKIDKADMRPFQYMVNSTQAHSCRKRQAVKEQTALGHFIFLN